MLFHSVSFFISIGILDLKYMSVTSLAAFVVVVYSWWQDILFVLFMCCNGWNKKIDGLVRVSSSMDLEMLRNGSTD